MYHEGQLTTRDKFAPIRLLHGTTSFVCQPTTVRASPSHFLVGLFVDMTGKPIKFLNEIAKRVGFEPRNSARDVGLVIKDTSGGVSGELSGKV